MQYRATPECPAEGKLQARNRDDAMGPVRTGDRPRQKEEPERDHPNPR